MGGSCIDSTLMGYAHHTTHTHTHMHVAHLHLCQVFNGNVKQSHVYTHAARGIVRSVLEGYNAAIFAYGQTGSGKTYSITGGSTYKCRGLIPRAISDLFRGVAKDTAPGVTYKVQVSYVEIYNEVVYDLLDRCVCVCLLACCRRTHPSMYTPEPMKTNLSRNGIV